MSSAEQEVREFIEAHTARVAPLLAESNLAQWEAATSGSAEATERSASARTAVKQLYSDPADAARVRRWLATEDAIDPLLRRQLVLLDHAYTGNQLPAETIRDLSAREAELEHTFQTFRATLDGEQVSNNELLEILRKERDNGRRRRAWEASKQIGQQVAEPLRELVRRRNRAARSLGFDNFYTMELHLQELDEADLFRTLDEFEALSESAFRDLRDEIDQELSSRYGVAVADLRPWHWEDPFAQQAPSMGDLNLDDNFRGRDGVATAAEFFRSIGLPTDDVLDRSDLFEREGKDQHAFCTDIDREGDVRVLCNMRDDEHWMHILLHELGHAVYDKFIPRSLPFLLRGPAHTLSTEAIAMYMGRLTRNAEWLRAVMEAEISDEEAASIRRQLRALMLISARWILVMSHFERELYRDPERPDLNRLWWDLVERLQRVQRPDGRDEPDWASKIHLSGAPAYYHNYLLGELMASQLAAAVRRECGSATPLPGNTCVGDFFRSRVFAPGASVTWNELLQQGTGEGLNPRYFVEQFVTG